MGGCGVQIPGVTTELEFTIIFCIEPGAGIIGIGKLFITAPVQYEITAGPNKFTKLKVDKFVNPPAINADLKPCFSSGTLPVCIEI